MFIKCLHNLTSNLWKGHFWIARNKSKALWGKACPLHSNFSCFSCPVAKLYPNLCNPHWLQHARLLCLPRCPGVSDSCQSNQWCYLTISFSPPPSTFALNLSQNQGFFSSESAVCIRCPKYWSFSFSTSLSSEYLGLISFKIDWFDLLAVQGTLQRPVPPALWVWRLSHWTTREIPISTVLDKSKLLETTINCFHMSVEILSMITNLLCWKTP